VVLVGIYFVEYFYISLRQGSNQSMYIILEYTVNINSALLTLHYILAGQAGREITIIQEFVGYNWLAMKFK